MAPRSEPPRSIPQGEDVVGALLLSLRAAKARCGLSARDFLARMGLDEALVSALEFAVDPVSLELSAAVEASEAAVDTNALLVAFHRVEEREHRLAVVELVQAIADAIRRSFPPELRRVR